MIRSTSTLLGRASRPLRPPTMMQPNITRRVAATPSGRRDYASRSLSSDDKLAIMELCYKFDRCINKQDVIGAASLFTKEGVLHNPKGQFQGREEISGFFKLMQPIASKGRHLTSNIIVEQVSSNTAKAYSYRLFHLASTPPALLSTGWIEDELVLDDEGWHFSERRLMMDPPAVPPSPPAPQTP